MAPTALLLRSRGAPLEGLLMQAGFDVVHVPTAELVARRDPPPPPAAIVIVTSATTARLCPTLPEFCRRAQVWAVGAATADALAAVGIEVDRVGDQGGAPLLAVLGSREAVFVGALQPAGPMATAIAQGRVAHWPVYARRTPHGLSARLSALPEVDLVVLTSPNQAQVLAEEGPPTLRDVPVVAIGGTTADAARAAGFARVHVAAQPDFEALVDAAVALFDPGDEEGPPD